MKAQTLAHATQRILLAAAVATTATLTANAADKYWVAADGIGNWADANWSTTAGGSGTTFDDGSTAYIYLPVNNINLNGQSPTVWSFRSSNSYSPSNLGVLNIYNTSETDSTLTIKVTGFSGNDIKNMVVTFGGSESVGKVTLYNYKSNNDSRCPLDLKHNSHLVFDDNSEYTEIDGKFANYIGNADGTSDSITVKTGAVMTLGNALYIANPANSTGAFVVDGGTVNVSSMIVVGGNDGSKGTLKVNGGSLSLTDTIYMGDQAGSTGELEMNGGSLTAAKGLNIGQRSTATVTVNGGSMSIAGADTIIGNEGDGVLTINGGTVEFGSSTVEKWTSLGRSSGSSGALYLNGGQLKLSHVRKQSGTGALVFNGGTLAANKVAGSNYGLINANLPVTVNAGGGTIDNGGLDILIPATLGGSGGLTFTGSGTTTLSGAVNYSGKTYVAAGTTLSVANETAKNNILANGLVLAGVPAAVGQTVMAYTEDLTGADLSKVTCPLAPGTEFAIGGDGNTAIVVKTVGTPFDNYWTGAANDGNLSNAANWLNGLPSGNANIFCAAPATLTVGDSFAPSSITFIEDSAKVTIEGRELSGITAITNHVNVGHVFNCAVSTTAIDFCNVGHCCEFLGGITLGSATFNGTVSDTARGIVGRWHFTGDWTPVSYNRIWNNSSVTVAGELLNPNNMTIDSGSVVTAATMRATTSTYPAYGNNGRIVVTGMMDIQSTSDFFLARQDDQNATIIAGGIVYNTGSWPWLNAKTLVFGTDGINFDSTNDNRLRFSNSAGISLYPRDATLTLGGAHAGKTQEYMINTGTILTVNTKRFESDEAATVTVDGTIANYGSGGMAVTGNGTLVFNSASTFSGGLTVGDTATVKVNANCTPGSGDITLGAGTTLALTATNKDFTPLANTLNLPTGENEVATIRIDGARLKSGDHEIATVGTGATANVALDLAGTALDGRKASLRVEDGKLVLKVTPSGLMLIFR